MHNKIKYARPLATATAVVALALGAAESHAAVTGVSGPSFNLTARADYISAGDGQGIWMWGYSNGATMQYPGPTLIVDQGQTVTVNLTNALNNATGAPLTANAAVSIIFPGQSGVVASVTPAGATACATDGLLTKEIPAGCADTVSYTFTASKPGTYMYHSGTRPDLQTEMGLFGTLIVRPAADHQAYETADSQYGHEYLFVLSEVDIDIHQAVEGGNLNPDITARHAQYWFINGRNGTDTLLGDNLPWFPTQPYGALAQTHAGDKTLFRVVQAGADLHPFHTHGNNFTLIAHDGRLLESAPGAGADLATSDFTLKAIPGETYDALWSWTGAGLGWDIYGYTPSNCPNPYPADKMTQDPTDRCKALKVNLPSPGSLTAGQGFSGGPFLGSAGALPPGEATLNVYNGLFFMWHSHTERELTNGDIFPGGMMTFMVVQPPNAPIE